MNYTIRKHVFNSFLDTTQVFNAVEPGMVSIYPPAEEQKRRIKELSMLPCHFAFIIDLPAIAIRPIEGIKFPFNDRSITVEEFCRHIHPTYLVPFLAFAQFTYEVVMRSGIARKEMITGSHKTPVPLKLPGSDAYIWYLQTAFAISVNDENKIVTQLNLYSIERPCLQLPNGEIENRLIESSFIVNNQLEPALQAYMQNAVRDYLKKAFEKQYKHLKILYLLKADINQSNKALAEKIGLSEETIKSYSKDILRKIKSVLGYQFVSLREAVTALSYKNYI